MDRRDSAEPLPEAGGDAADSLHTVQAMLGYTFQNLAHLQRALTHASSTADKTRDNERLEFFGDAILGLIVCEHLYHTCPRQQEGELTEVKSMLVRRQTLARAARNLGLRQHLILGRGIAQRKRLPDSVFANVFEALVAALYLDGGYDVARSFVLEHLGQMMDEAQVEAAQGNYKSLLQELVQRDLGTIPTYRVIGEHGPDHQKTFAVCVEIQGREVGRGEGLSKKAGEQAAACQALRALEADPPRATALDACPCSADPDTAHPGDAEAPGMRTADVED